MALKSLRAHEGELLVDHRDSPGVPDDLIAQWRAAGKLVEPAPAGLRFESAVQTCAHCQATIVMNPLRTRPRHYCAKCDHYVCDAPVCVVTCTPIQQTLDQLARAPAVILP